jgi:predicted ATPase/class 3 adenylate cyclase
VSEPQGGIVSFLFTDIEGSTRLWEADQEAMSAALRRHDAILHAAIASAEGRVFKTAGDAFCAAFPTPPMALEAAVEAQRALVTEAWAPVAHVRVRMAIHSGPAESRGGDYFGQPLNRVARLLAAAHGEQIVVSRATSELLREQLPEGLNLRDLGEYALKDLPEPERIWQVIAPGLRHDFPPLRTPERLLRNLPRPSTPLIGRENAIAAARQAFGLPAIGVDGSETRTSALPANPSTRLLTLTGPGGTGKSRLALHLAREIGLELADGAVFVPLAAITDPTLVPVAISNALELAEGPGDAPRQLVLDQLQDRHLLLVLDNFEQVMGAAPFVADILKHAPRVLVLATSRERLHVRGEQELPLPPLALPAPRLSEAAAGVPMPLTIEEIGCSPAVQLFVARAQAGKPGFALTDDNAQTIAELCRRLDGLPLAIELAAARVRLLSPQALLERFDRRLDVLSRGARDLPDRQRTMRDTIAWSYDLLDPDEQRLFANLSVFVGGATLSAVCAILSDTADSGADQIDLLELLADKSLLRIVDSDDEPRLFMFETIRDYACERLSESGENDIIAQCHADFYLAFAEEAEPRLAGREQSAWLSRLERDQANLRAAITWLRAHGQPEKALRLGAALWRFWWLRGDVGAASALLEELLGEVGAGDPALRAKALTGAGVLAESQGDWDRAARLHEESLQISQCNGDLLGVAWSLDNLGVVEINQGNYDRASDLLEEALTVAEQAGNAASIATALIDLEQIAHARGDSAKSVSLLTRSLELFRAIGDESYIARALNNLGGVYFEAGDFDRARELFSESLALHRSIGDRQAIASTLNNLAEVAKEIGDTEAALSLSRESYSLAIEGGNRLYAAIASECLGALNALQGVARLAEAHYRESLNLYRAVRDQQGTVSSLVGLASAAQASGDARRAVSLFAAASAIYDANSAIAFPDVESQLQALRFELGDACFDSVWQTAKTIPLDSVIDEAAIRANPPLLPRSA